MRSKGSGFYNSCNNYLRYADPTGYSIQYPSGWHVNKYSNRSIRTSITKGYCIWLCIREP